ncbi:GNAT family N-acetyltransferase [uncultured Lactobacillus sp.]|uniref:GNAT family N-acetyltransferase n=1 Tax=uncultured Lactobacillus sp. TaxID=153152 RepID=UPI0025F1D6E8|nr:GNAT family N-acetyltransferase [uncultured Lactobacillus sp.]
MIIVEKVNLSDKEQRQANELTERVQKADRTYSDFYLSNQFNYFQDMPTFILAYDENKLVGLTMLYADEGPEEEVEVNLEVDPEFRRQGIATRMFEHAKRIMVQYGYHKWEFVTEKVFLEKNPSFLKNMSLKVVPEDSDYYMRTVEAVMIEKTDKLNQVLAVKPLTMSYVDQVAKAHSNAFGDAIATSTKYIKNSLLDKDTKSFILLKGNEVLGYCAVDHGENEDYFFGLFIDKPFRGKGFGTFFIKKMMVILQKEGSKVFALNADVDNKAAIHIYEKAGFKILSETLYLKSQES